VGARMQFFREEKQRRWGGKNDVGEKNCI